MGIDTGAGYAIILEQQWRSVGSPKLTTSGLQLIAYTGEPVDIKGEYEIEVRFKQQTQRLPLMGVAGSNTALCGRNWLRCLKLNWDQLLHLQTLDQNSRLAPFQDVFRPMLRTIQVTPVRLDLKLNHSDTKQPGISSRVSTTG